MAQSTSPTDSQPGLKRLSFSVNNWNHLYSLQAALQHNQQGTGRSLSIQGRLLNQAFLRHQDTPVSIRFMQTEQPPEYPRKQDRLVLAEMQRQPDGLSCEIAVDRGVFEELRKNLMEYADIEGIHIMLSLELLCEQAEWPDNQSLPLVELSYAMKGDA
jgi:hypothetical protein